MTFAVKILLCLQTSQYRGFGDVLIGIYRPKKYQIKLGVAFEITIYVAKQQSDQVGPDDGWNLIISETCSMKSIQN